MDVLGRANADSIAQAKRGYLQERSVNPGPELIDGDAPHKM